MGFETALARRVSARVSSRDSSSRFGGGGGGRGSLGAILVGLMVVGVVFSPIAMASAGSRPWSAFGEAFAVKLGEGSNPWAVLLRSDAEPGYGGVAFHPAEDLTFAGIYRLKSDFDVTDDDCGGGAPRFSVAIDQNGDGAFKQAPGGPDGNVFVYFGPFPNFVSCPAGWHSTGNFIEVTDLRFDTSQVGGTFYDSYSNALTLVGTKRVLWVSLVVDAGWFSSDGEQTILVDNVEVNDHILSAKGFAASVYEDSAPPGGGFTPPPGPCVFVLDALTATMTLTADCSTTTTILVPDGWTLEGANHAIAAVDPVGGHFRGAVVMNGGAVANVQNLIVTAFGLANVCDGGPDRLRGILFDGASGAIVGNTVADINQGASGCQEGNGIEVRSVPFDDTHPDPKFVTIHGNVVRDYQKNGITANGDVIATITDNVVAGAGPVDYIAQNGIQIGFGGSARVAGNEVSGNDYTPQDWLACGLLYFDATGVEAKGNHLSANERNVCNVGRGGGQVFATTDDTSTATVEVSATNAHGFDEFGYNDNARVFVGTGISWCMGKLGGTETYCAAYMDPYGNDRVVMKWNAEWDRGNTEDWANPPYAAWTSNHWNGNTEGGSGAVWQYKIVWVGVDLQNSPYWRPGGYAIWGQFEVVMDQGHDPYLGIGHLWFTHGIPSGYGGGPHEDATALTSSASSSCVTIQDGGLVDSMGNPLVLGFDQFGYNYQAHEFVGTYDSSDRVLDGTYWGQTGDFVDDKLAMKWSDDWLANKDCNGDGKLDRGTSGVSLGWLTNHVVGDYDWDGDGTQDARYTDFVKIVWVGPGGDLWGEYRVILEVYNDSLGGSHGLLYKEAPAGFGLNDGWTIVS